MFGLGLLLGLATAAGVLVTGNTNLIPTPLMAVQVRGSIRKDLRDLDRILTR